MYTRFIGDTNLATFAPNLLDNSNFTNPVNQGYYGDSFVFDRWRSSASNVISTGCVTVPSGGWLKQVLETHIPNATYTLAAKTTDGSVNVIAGTFENTTGNSRLAMGLNTAGNPCVTLYSGSYEWAALYEGKYDERNLPVYRARSYHEELMECMRYYQEPARAYVTYSGVFRETNIITASIPLAVPMRIDNPTFTYNTFDGGLYRLRAYIVTIDGTIFRPMSAALRSAHNNIVSIDFEFTNTNESDYAGYPGTVFLLSDEQHLWLSALL